MDGLYLLIHSQVGTQFDLKSMASMASLLVKVPALIQELHSVFYPHCGTHPLRRLTGQVFVICYRSDPHRVSLAPVSFGPAVPACTSEGIGCRGPRACLIRQVLVLAF